MKGVDIYLATLWLHGKYPPLFTSTLVSNLLLIIPQAVRVVVTLTLAHKWFLGSCPICNACMGSLREIQMR